MEVSLIATGVMRVVPIAVLTGELPAKYATRGPAPNIATHSCSAVNKLFSPSRVFFPSLNPTPQAPRSYSETVDQFLTLFSHGNSLSEDW